jgi:hypothetical protein
VAGMTGTLPAPRPRSTPAPAPHAAAWPSALSFFLQSRAVPPLSCWLNFRARSRQHALGPATASHHVLPLDRNSRARPPHIRAHACARPLAPPFPVALHALPLSFFSSITYFFIEERENPHP